MLCYAKMWINTIFTDLAYAPILSYHVLERSRVPFKIGYMYLGKLNKVKLFRLFGKGE